jgi:hypothetical protein
MLLCNNCGRSRGLYPPIPRPLAGEEALFDEEFSEEELGR